MTETSNKGGRRRLVSLAKTPRATQSIVSGVSTSCAFARLIAACRKYEKRRIDLTENSRLQPLLPTRWYVIQRLGAIRRHIDRGEDWANEGARCMCRKRKRNQRRRGRRRRLGHVGRTEVVPTADAAAVRLEPEALVWLDAVPPIEAVLDPAVGGVGVVRLSGELERRLAQVPRLAERRDRPPADAPRRLGHPRLLRLLVHRDVFAPAAARLGPVHAADL
mmetsp:Transcript_9112/g.27467  ORF Transcript_9112/g.27467 Transcript_9112/m.27467 type:complete len:220 (-) Transcript_9112:2963-3622(-)